MHLCINCNSADVVRTGDTFVCKKCKYTWDVAHELANAAYLASQGRQPAGPVSEQTAATSPEDSLLNRLGIAPMGTPDGTPLPEMDPTDDESDEGIIVELHEPAPGDVQAYQALTTALEKKTVPMLDEIAAEADVDLTDASLKADKIERIATSGRVWLDDDGETIVVVSVDETDESED